jgi:anti-sigma factor RsiW
MNCSDISALAPLYLSGDLDPACAGSFSAHLGNCPACKREMGQQTSFDKLLRASVLAEDIDSSSVDHRVRESIRAGRGTSRRWMFAAAGIAALTLLGIVGYRVVFSPRTQPVYAAAARDHRLEIVDRQPRKWFTDRASIEKLAERQGLAGSVVSAFAPAGYRLAQGKLCLLDGRVFLHLVYTGVSRSEAGNFSLFLRRPDDAIKARVRMETIAAEHVAGFQDGRLTALIVGDQPSDTVLNLAKSAASVL